MTAPFAEVIGDPVEQSKSPVIHRFWLEKLAIEGDYRASRVMRAELKAFLDSRRTDPDWRGCNVTMPLKLDAAAIADQVTDRAVAAGAANLLVPRDGQIVAANTDVGGVLHLLGPRFEHGACNVTLLGNGGAARAVLVALRTLGCDQVRIQARDLGEAYKLAVEFRLSEEPRSFDRPVDTQGLVNATPLGMSGMEPIMIDIGSMPADGWVFDLVTGPTPTALLVAAEARGLATVDGIAMLVEQAAESFKAFFGQDAPRRFDRELMASLRNGTAP
jgi:shikimate dehydrogenase